MNDAVQQEGLMTVAEVQEMLSASRTKVYSMISRRELPAVRIGRAVRVRKSAVTKYLEEHGY